VLALEYALATPLLLLLAPHARPLAPPLIPGTRER
jgi:hypothetical protein